MLICVQTIFRMGDRNQVTAVANGRTTQCLDGLGMVLAKYRGTYFSLYMPYAF